MSVQKDIPKPEPQTQTTYTTTSGIQVQVGRDPVQGGENKVTVQEMQEQLTKDIPSDILRDEPQTAASEEQSS